MVRILFVCLGNICRSPLAEGLMRHAVKKHGLEEKIIVDSCGTSNYHIGNQPDLRTRSNAEMNGISLYHEARQFSIEDFVNFDYILAMDRSNLRIIEQLDEKRDHSEKLFLMREFDPGNHGADVPDPYYGGESGFQQVFDILELSTKKLLEHIIEENTLKG